jgi:hypothetical protein
MAVAFIALFIALAGTAYSVSSQVPGKGGVKASDIAKGAVKKGKIAGQAVAAGKIANGAVESAKIANKAVTSGKFFLSVVSNQNIGQVPASNCTGSGFQAPESLLISTPGIQATDHVLVTPPPGFADTFVLTAHPDPANSRVVVAACNNFFSGSGDPDGGGGPYKVLVVR